MPLCSTLQPIYELEVSLGNSIKSIEAPAGTHCFYAVNFRKKLHLKVIYEQLLLPESVVEWSNKDHHYDLQTGFYCNKFKHSIAGPLK